MNLESRTKSICKHYKFTNLKATYIHDLNNPKILKLLHKMDPNNSYIIVVSIHIKITHFECGWEYVNSFYIFFFFWFWQFNSNNELEKIGLTQPLHHKYIENRFNSTLASQLHRRGLTLVQTMSPHSFYKSILHSYITVINLSMISHVSVCKKSYFFRDGKGRRSYKRY